MRICNHVTSEEEILNFIVWNLEILFYGVLEELCVPCKTLLYYFKSLCFLLKVGIPHHNFVIIMCHSQYSLEFPAIRDLVKPYYTFFHNPSPLVWYINYQFHIKLTFLSQMVIIQTG